MRTCKDCKSELPLDASNFQKRTRFNSDGKARIVYDNRCKPCQILRNHQIQAVTGRGAGAKREPYKLTGFQDPIDRLFFCELKS